MTQRTFLLSAALVVLVALGLRESFVLAAWTPDPTRGDAGEYLRYVHHLVFDGVFSGAAYGEPVVPDAYRSPGYPFLLSLLWDGQPWEGSPRFFNAIYHLQALFGAATVACLIALGRLWMPRAWALGAGLLLALQPHHIAATETILTEVTFGLCIAAGLLCATLALQRKSVWLGLLAGAVMGFGYLVNPVLALLPFVLLPLFRKDWRPGLAMVAVMVLAIGGWGLRNAVTGAQGDNRAAINFVQGSWPKFHDAWKYQDFLMYDQYKAIVAEVNAVVDDRDAGLRQVATRLASDPWHYAKWYTSKPMLLFGWDVRIGMGGIYTIKMHNSPLDRGPLFYLSALQNGLNGVLFGLALIGLVVAFRGKGAAVALAVVYLTAVHVVLQAEPRYSIPYKGLEIMLAMGAAAWLCRFVFKSAPHAEAGGDGAGVLPGLVPQGDYLGR